MGKGQECDCCENFSGYTDETFLVCTMHPSGPECEPCPDFEQTETNFFLSSTELVDGDLVMALVQLSELRDLGIEIQTHPRLTGCCLECGSEFDQRLPSSLYWDCDCCGWRMTALLK